MIAGRKRGYVSLSEEQGKVIFYSSSCFVAGKTCILMLICFFFWVVKIITGSRVVISILCVPLVAGYVRPPQLGLPNVEEANVSSNPPGPHLVCVLPPLLSSSYCVPVK